MKRTNSAIPILIEIPGWSSRNLYPIELGFPLPQGLLRDPSYIRLFSDNREPISTDVSTTMQWSDGSIRWALLRFIARQKSYEVHLNSSAPVPDVPSISLQKRPREVGISTGSAHFSVSTEKFLIVSPDKRFTADLVLRDVKRRPYYFAIDRVESEHNGNVCVVLSLKGRFIRSTNHEICQGECRVWFWAGTALVRLEFTLWNPRAARHRGGIWDLGDPGSIFFRSLHFPVSFQNVGSISYHVSLNPGDDLLDSDNPVLSVFQGSSGGANWRSLVHVDRFNCPTPKFSGYKLMLGSEAREGLRCNPAIIYSVGESAAAFAIEDFWQRFPNRLYAKDGAVSLEPFPDADNQVFELQGGEKTTFRLWMDLAPENRVQPLLCARVKPAAAISYHWYSGLEYLPGFPTFKEPGKTWLDELINSGIDGPNSFFDRRESFDEYGWRNFGDTPADHERQHYSGSREFVSHYNNQYDLILGYLSRFAATHDPRWFELGRDLARHVMDHDLYSTTRDRAAYNGGYFWHTAHYLHAGTATHRSYSRRAVEGNKLPKGFGGGPSNEHDYSSGLMLYFLMTGDRRAKEAVIQLAEWVRCMQDPWRNLFRFLSRNPTGLATCTRKVEFQGPGRGGAYSVNTCLDAFVLTDDSRWLKTAEEYIRICIHPSTNPDEMGLLDREERWSYVVFLQVLARYLNLKLECGEVDIMFHYGRASLLSYCRWMAKKEYPYLDLSEQLEYPTATWAAQDLRKSSVFFWASRYADSEQKKIFLEKARFFEERSGQYLSEFEDRSSTRNIALSLSYCAWGNGDFGIDCALLRDIEPHFGEPFSFIPQKLDAIRKLRRILCTFGVAAIPELASYIKDSHFRKSKFGDRVKS